jgi:hypothetical protein
MATANVENRKTQTRRVITFPIVNADGQWADPEKAFLDRSYEKPEWGGCACLKMPYGPEWSDLHTIERIFPKWQAGDTIYQKETFSKDFADHYPHDPIWYRADNDRSIDIVTNRNGVQGIWSPESNRFVPFKWTPSIFMPRESSRFTATITQVRVQRLQEITDEDAEAEGIKPLVDIEPFPAWQSTAPDMIGKVKSLDHITPYRSLWNLINLPPKPILGPKDKATGKRPITGYISHPWSIEDFHSAYPPSSSQPSTLNSQPSWHGKALHIFPNPWLHAITYQRI